MTIKANRRRGTNGPGTVRDRNRRIEAIATAAVRADLRGEVRRGTLAYVRCDINTLSERGSRPDGSDRHLVKGRPVVLWGVDLSRAQPTWLVVPLSRSGDSVAMRDPILRPDGSTMAGAAMSRLVRLHPDEVAHVDVVGTLSDRDMDAIAAAIASGEILDLTASTGTQPVARKVVAGRQVWGADDALAELVRRRERHCAAARQRMAAADVSASRSSDSMSYRPAP